MPAEEVEWWCEVIAPIKSRTTNRQDRHLLTRYIVEIVTEHGVGMREMDLAKIAPS